jgi:hypothetical protein
MSLKAIEIKAFQPRQNTYRKADDKGLYLKVRPNGSKLWFLKYRHLGAEKRIGLGMWPDVSLAQARDKRDEIRKAVQQGEDPLHQRKMRQIAAKVDADNTFQSVAEDFITVRLISANMAQPTIDEARWFFAHLAPALGKRPIADIEAAELLAVLKPIEKSGKRETARRIRAFASRVFLHGVATARCESDPAALLRHALAAPEVKHFAAITDVARLGEFLRAIDDYTGGPIVKTAMQLLPHLFVRPGELRKATWDEIDWDNASWTIPAERMKLRRPHVEPLSHQALALLRGLQRHSGAQRVHFPGPAHSPYTSVGKYAESCLPPYGV